MGRKRLIVIDNSGLKNGSSQSPALQVVCDWMGLGGSVYGGLKETGSYILSRRGRKRQPSLAESFRTGRKPDIGF